MCAAMEIRQRQSGPVAIVELTGRLTVNDQPGLLKKPSRTAIQDGARHVLLVLSASTTSTARGSAS
jgi:hypothetical protein